MANARKVTVAEYHAEMTAQGVPRDHVAWKCFMCDTVQSLASFLKHDVPRDRAERMIGFSCVGRVDRALPPHIAKGKNEGCDWSIGGLFSFSDFIVVTEDGKEHKTFPLATPEEAQALMRANEPSERHATAEKATAITEPARPESVPSTASGDVPSNGSSSLSVSAPTADGEAAANDGAAVASGVCV